MSDYNYPLDLTTDNTNFNILKRISPDSTVLEIGAAHGRMTKYLKESLNCCVDIIEINEAAGKDAAKYAEQALLGERQGNIEGTAWIKLLGLKQYDYIIFADVLEHLHHPEKVLETCKRFLKDTGSILCSIPNICHASVILAMLDGEFKYTDVGLLDRTHIRFFTNTSFKAMCVECGYQITYEHAILVPAGGNEIPYDYSSVSSDIENALRNRPNNEAYQYVFELVKKLAGYPERGMVRETIPPMTRKCKCLLRSAEDAEFNEHKQILKAILPGKVELVFPLRKDDRTDGVYLQLIDCNALVHVKRISCIANDKETEILNYDTDALRVGDEYLCAVDKGPSISFYVPYECELLKCQYEVLIYNSDILRTVGTLIISQLAQEQKQLVNQIHGLKATVQEQKTNLDVMNSEIQKLDQQSREYLNCANDLKQQLTCALDKVETVNAQKLEFEKLLAETREQNVVYREQLEKAAVLQSQQENCCIQLKNNLCISEDSRKELLKDYEELKHLLEECQQKQQNTVEVLQKEELISMTLEKNLEDKNGRIAEYEAQLSEMQQQVTGAQQKAQENELICKEALSKLNKMTKQLQTTAEAKATAESQIQWRDQEILTLQQHIDDMQKTISYRCAAPIRLAGRVFRFGKRLTKKALQLSWKTTKFFVHNGPIATVKRAKEYLITRKNNISHQKQINEAVQNEDIWTVLSKWIDETPHEFIDIFPVPMGWNTPLFQRFQHLSIQAGNAGGISFYGAHPQVDTDVETYKFVSPTLCVINLLDAAVVEKFWSILDTKPGLKYLRIQSIDLATTTEQIKSFLRRGYQIVYEYIDELTPQITGNIPEFVWERHEYVLRDETITVIATSDKLFNQVKPYRSQNMLMLNNGVDYDHWHIEKSIRNCPEDIRHIVTQNKIIIGYHGALAQWIDYDLLKRIADDDRFVLLLIGYEHDDCLKKSGLLDKKNVYFIGSRPYQELSKYAIFYDVAILPFMINNITLSVSPVKIFEYMAGDKPVVTYALPECKKYQSCLCADTQDEFMAQLEKALTLRNDPAYIQMLREDALNNTWIAITKKMIQHIQENQLRIQLLHESQRILNPRLSDEYKVACLEQMVFLPKHRATEYQELTNTPYVRKEGDCKVIAYYLTQFHPDPHNEAWWGRGTTEWNNVCRAVPQYIGHYQPRIPGELGYYDLRIKENMQRQIELAKMYGVYGFSFYYYWFDGERLLERPLETFLNSPEMDFPFSICWANENWTKRYDGTNLDILMEQPKSAASYRNVIHDMIRFLKDPRYIEVDGKKLITVYRPSLMPEHKQILSYWRKYCRKHGVGELYIIAVKENMVETDWLAAGFDAVSEFHPGTLYTNLLNITHCMEFLRKDFGGEVYSYEDIVKNQKYFKYDYAKLYRAVMPMWDNTARRDHKGMIFEGSTPALYKRWMKDVIRAGAARKDLEDNLIFINAWNEWGEGAYLEPDKRFGYAYLNATKEAVEECRE